MSAKFMVSAAKAGESPASTEAEALANASCRASRLESLLLKCIFTSRYNWAERCGLARPISCQKTDSARKQAVRGRSWAYCAGANRKNRALSDRLLPLACSAEFRYVHGPLALGGHSWRYGTLIGVGPQRLHDDGTDHRVRRLWRTRPQPVRRDRAGAERAHDCRGQSSRPTAAGLLRSPGSRTARSVRRS